MEHKIKLFLMVIIFSGFIGCIDVHYKMKLKPDGSGTIEETVYMSAAMIEMLQGFMTMDNDSTKEEFNLFNETDLRNEALKLGEGVKYISGEELDDNGRKGYKAIYEFEDVNKIKMDQDVSDKAPSMGEDTEDTPEDDITFRFSKGNPAELTIIMPEEKETSNEATEVEEDEENEYESNEQAESEWTDEVKGIMKDFRILIELEVDGDIVETNATYVDGSTLTLMEMSFAKLLDNPEELNKLKNLDEASYEKSKEILEKIPGIKFEMNEKVNVVFK